MPESMLGSFQRPQLGDLLSGAADCCNLGLEDCLGLIGHALDMDQRQAMLLELATNRHVLKLDQLGFAPQPFVRSVNLLIRELPIASEIGGINCSRNEVPVPEMHDPVRRLLDGADLDISRRLEAAAGSRRPE